MESIILKPKTKKKEKEVLTKIKEIGGVDIEKISNVEKPAKNTKNLNIRDLKGMWKDYDYDINIRK